MPVEPTSITGLLVVKQPTHDDGRGFFRQLWVASELEAALDRSLRFVQGNHARSDPGVLRGFHAEPWDKLVHVVTGRILAVVADLRPDSSTFGEHVAVELGDGTDATSLFVTEGLGNAYAVVGDEAADYIYQITAEWLPEVDKRAVRWDDPTLGVRWPVEDPVVSEADRDAPALHERFPDHPRFAEESR